jgi:hypothetical protein
VHHPIAGVMKHGCWDGTEPIRRTNCDCDRCERTGPCSRRRRGRYTVGRRGRRNVSRVYRTHRGSVQDFRLPSLAETMHSTISLPIARRTTLADRLFTEVEYKKYQSWLTVLNGEHILSEQESFVVSEPRRLCGLKSRGGTHVRDE